MPEQFASPERPPQARLTQMATGFILSRIVYTAASLGIAEYLACGSKAAEDLAAPTGCDAVSLARFMRTLTNFGILTLSDDGRFSLTPLGEPLRSDAVGSVRSSILTMAGTVDVAGLGGVSVNGQDWHASYGYGVRHAGLRLARTASGRSEAFQ